MENEAGTREKVLGALLVQETDHSITDIAEEAGVSRPTAARCLEVLEAEGVVVSRQVGNATLFRLTEKGWSEYGQKKE